MSARLHIRSLVLQSCMLLAGVFACAETNAQEDPTNRQYLFNLLNINPAYAGTRGVTTMTPVSASNGRAYPARLLPAFFRWMRR
jgi:hypothetical protein